MDGRSGDHKEERRAAGAGVVVVYICGEGGGAPKQAQSPRKDKKKRRRRAQECQQWDAVQSACAREPEACAGCGIHCAESRDEEVVSGKQLLSGVRSKE